MSKMLVVNLDKCTGCRTCEIVCSLVNTGECNPARSRIHNIKFSEEGLHFTVVCFQCDKAPCAQICPTGAITRDEVTGIVRVSGQSCLRCKMCLLACPFGNITYSTRENRVVKCELCNGKPACVEFCVTGALEFKDLDTSMIPKKRILSEKLMKGDTSMIPKKRILSEKLMKA